MKDLRKCETLLELKMELESEFQQKLKEMNSKPDARQLLDIKGTSEILRLSEAQICYLVLEEKLETIMKFGNMCFYQDEIIKHSAASESIEKEVMNG